MCNYCGSPREKYGHCLKCQNEICEDCASPVKARIFDRAMVHKAGHCWGFRYSQLLIEIKEKSKSVYQQSKGTPFEDLGFEVNQIGQNLSLIRDPIGLKKETIIMEIILSNICDKMPEEELKETCNFLEIAKNEPLIEDKLKLINIILSKIHSQMSLINLEKKLDELMISLKPGIHEELVLTVGAEFLGTGMKHVITIPLQEISYSELKEDLGKIKGKRIEKFSTFPQKLAMKIKDFLIKTRKDEILEMLT